MSKAVLRSVTTWQGSRRTVVRGALGAAGGALAAGTALTAGIAGAQEASPVASPAASPAASPVAAGGSAHLLVADDGASALYVYAIPGFALTGQLDGVGLEGHGGTFLLEDGRLLFADVLNGEIVELAISAEGVPEITRSVPASLGDGVSWICASPALSHLSVGTLTEGRPNQTLNIVDLATFENTALEFAMAEDEEIHSWLTGDPPHVHVSVGGRIDSYALADLMAGTTEPVGSVPVALGSHGGATDAANGRILLSTGVGGGYEVLDAADGPATYRQQIPWDVDGLVGGRTWRPRVLRDGAHLFGAVLPAPEEPARWAEVEASNHVVDLDGLTASRFPVGAGSVSLRWGMSDDLALWAGYDADGASAYVIDADAGSDTFGQVTRTIAIARPSKAATAGEDPADAEFYPMTTVTPDGAYGFVTVNGDGVVQAIDLASGRVVADIAVPSALAGGGYVTVVQAGTRPFDLWAR